MTLPSWLGYCGDRFDNERRYTPPRWMRRVISWKVLNWISDHSDTCWSNMVMWKLGYDCENWWPSAACFKPYDYCHKFDGKPLPEIPDPVFIVFNDEVR